MKTIADAPLDDDPRASRYLVKSVMHCARVLAAFTCPDETLRLKEISSRCGLPKSMTFRLIFTLTHCGVIERVDKNLYRAAWSIPNKRRTRARVAEPSSTDAVD